MSAKRFAIKLNKNGMYYNGFTDSVVVGSLMFQWGQANSTSDANQTFNFHQSFGSACYALLTTCSYANVWSAMPVIARNNSNFVLNRDNAIDGDYPFYWIAIGDAPGRAVSNPGSAALGESVVEWGNAVSTSDGYQNFTMPVAMGAGVSSAVLTVTEANIRSALSIRDFNGAARTLTLNRHNDINGAIDFNYVAVGAKAGDSSDGVQQMDGFKLQWGSGDSSSDHEQLFLLHESFADMNFSVITTLNADNHRQGLSLTRPVNPRSFIVNRDGGIDGTRKFNWLAIGR